MRPSPARQAGFTLLEITIAVTVLAMAMTLIVLTFSNISRAWRDGTAAAAGLNHADAILDQLSAGLRSAYYKKSGRGQPSPYGFWLDNDGGGSTARDRISWVKTGSALVDPTQPEAGSLHRVTFTVEDDDRGRPAAAIKLWRPFGQKEEFDPEREAPLFFLASGVVGFDCEVATNVDGFGSFEWETEWEETNRLPAHVHLTLFLKPGDPDREPLKVERIVSLPTAPLSW